MDTPLSKRVVTKARVPAASSTTKVGPPPLTAMRSPSVGLKVPASSVATSITATALDPKAAT